jgi:ribonuclease P protein component
LRTETHDFFSIKMNFTYPKNEKLKSKITIGLLFSEGKSVSKYPLRLVYYSAPLATPEASAAETGQNIKMGVSVSKKYFKKAVDRNYFKRVLRETYRLNKHLLIENLDQPYSFMLFYQSKDRLSYEEINTKTIQLFEKFVAQTTKINSTDDNKDTEKK